MKFKHLMKQSFLLILILLFSMQLSAQTIKTQRISDWNDLKYSGFYESLGSTNLPDASSWHWGINIGHTLNANTSEKYSFGAQILFPVVGTNLDLPKMYIRSTNAQGLGTWAKVLLDKGNQSIDGNLSVTNNIVANKNIEINNNSMFGRLLSNNFTYDGKPMGHYALRWGDDSSATTWGPSLWQSAYGGMKFFTKGQLRMVVHAEGNVGIGTASPGFKLDVAGTIRSGNIIMPVGYQMTTSLTDAFKYDRSTVGHYSMLWTSDSWSDQGATMYQAAYGGIKFFTAGSFRMAISESGNVGIGTSNPQNKLDVAGTIRATEVKVEAGWADFVFDKDYKLRSLEEVKAHIDEHKHLPDIPSEAEVKENGVSLGEMQSKLLQKIEELTLYVIDLKNENKEQGKEIQELKTKLKQLEVE